MKKREFSNFLPSSDNDYREGFQIDTEFPTINEELLLMKVNDQFESIHSLIQNLNQVQDIEKLLLANSTMIEYAIDFLRNNDTCIYDPDVDYLWSNTSFDLILGINKIKNLLFPIKTVGDGNCFYRAISLLFFRSEEHFILIKVITLYYLIQEKAYFNSGFSSSYTQMILNAKKKNFYATQHEILAFNLAMERPIIVFSYVKGSNIPCVMKYDVSKLKNDQSLMIAHGEMVHHDDVDELPNHFVPLFRSQDIIRIPEFTDKSKFKKKK